MFVSIGLSNKHEEDEIDILDIYFRNNWNYRTSISETCACICYFLYYAKIVTSNNQNEEIKILETKADEIIDDKLLVVLRINNVIFNDIEDDMDNLKDWYIYSVTRNLQLPIV